MPCFDRGRSSSLPPCRPIHDPSRGSDLPISHRWRSDRTALRRDRGFSSGASCLSIRGSRGSPRFEPFPPTRARSNRNLRRDVKDKIAGLPLRRTKRKAGAHRPEGVLKFRSCAGLSDAERRRRVLAGADGRRPTSLHRSGPCLRSRAVTYQCGASKSRLRWLRAPATTQKRQPNWVRGVCKSNVPELFAPAVAHQYRVHSGGIPFAGRGRRLAESAWLPPA